MALLDLGSTTGQFNRTCKETEDENASCGLRTYLVSHDQNVHAVVMDLFQRLPTKPGIEAAVVSFGLKIECSAVRFPADEAADALD
jgi:hypothetical protein